MRRAWSGVGAAFVLLSTWALAASCDGTETSSTNTSSTTTSSTSAQASSSSTGGGGMGGAGGSGQGGQGGGTASNCPANTICLAVKPTETGSIQAGRLAVVWYQLNDDGPDPLPSIGYDMPFDPKATKIEIPTASIMAPNEENLICERACDDEAMCPCLSDPKVGVAYVFVVNDADNTGTINIDEINNELYGIGFMAVATSEAEYVPAPAPFDALFTEGIDKGTRGYHIVEGGPTDMLSRSKDGDVFDLNVCDAPSVTCAPPSPGFI
jgi:hypothetical protein